MTTWAEESAGAELGDGRLNRRLIKLTATFADNPTASIPGACPDLVGNPSCLSLLRPSQHGKVGLGLAGHPRSAHRLQRSPDAAASGRSLPARHD